MAVIKIDLPGHKEKHFRYHVEHNTTCNHDCRYYEDVGDPHSTAQREIIRRTIATLDRMGLLLSPEPHDDIFLETIRIRVFHTHKER